MIRGRVRKSNKLNSLLSSRVWKSRLSLIQNVCLFVFGGDAVFYRRTNKTATLNVSILYIVGLSLPCNSLLRCARCVVKETAPQCSVRSAMWPYSQHSNLHATLDPLMPTVAICLTILSRHLNFWRLGTRTLRAESQSVGMSKTANDCLTRSGTGCFIPVLIWQHLASKG